MKKLLTILIAVCLWCQNAQSDDIQDFEIEGLSVGESLLKHYSKVEIKNKSSKDIATFYKDKFVAIWFDSFSLKVVTQPAFTVFPFQLVLIFLDGFLLLVRFVKRTVQRFCFVV